MEEALKIIGKALYEIGKVVTKGINELFELVVDLLMQPYLQLVHCFDGWEGIDMNDWLDD